MKALRKCLYLIFGLFVFGLVSCANDSSSNDTYVPARNTDTDKNGQKYTDGFYKFDDGNTQMYLYYENRNLVSAGNAQGKFDSNRIEILKQSYSWNTVCKYCTRYEVSLRDKWMCTLYPAQKFFKKGWCKFTKGNDTKVLGYFESYDSVMSYATIYPQTEGFRTTNFNNAAYYSDSTWQILFLQYLNTDDGAVYFLSEELNYFKEENAQSN